MERETKICQNCQKEFIIEPEDFAFYEKIKVPPPTWCPECRLQRRLIFRNERTLYKRKCDLCGNDILSVYNIHSPFNVYCFKCFYSDKWDFLYYGKDYDFSQPFFEQFKKLIINAPKLAVQVSADIENCEYANHIASSKNCYLTFASTNNENCL